MSEFLSVSEFDERRESGRMALSLVGMSNVGKSYISEKLRDIGFGAVSCDDLIGESLLDVLAEQGRGRSLEDVAGHGFLDAVREVITESRIRTS